MYRYSIKTIEKAMISALSIYHPNDKAQALITFNNMKADVLRLSYQEAKDLSSKSITRLYECLWLLNEYKKNTFLQEDRIQIPLSRRIDTFYTIDRRFQSMPEILQEALAQQIQSHRAQIERFTRQQMLDRQRQAYDKNIAYLKKRVPSAQPKRRPKF